MAHWFFTENKIVTHINFDAFKGYFQRLCEGGTGYVDHYFKESKFQFFWRSKLLRKLPLRFPGLQVTVTKLDNETIKISRKAPTAYLIIMLCILLPIIFSTFLEGSFYSGLILLLTAYIGLFLSYKIGNKGFDDVIDRAIRLHKRNET